MKVLITGADGFVGPWLIRRLLADGHEVVAAARPREAGAGPHDHVVASVEWLPLELEDSRSVGNALDGPYDAVVHLAAVASGAAAARDPGAAWTVNAAGTARVAAVLADAKTAGRADPLFVVASTGEVYGRGPCQPRRETDPVRPSSPYAASKLGAEIAGLEAWQRAGLRTVIARLFTHTGPGQAARFVVPAFAHRLQKARHTRPPVVQVGNLSPVRDFLHVRDVVDAYAALLRHGVPGEIYNVASGRGVSLEEVLFVLAGHLGVRPVPEVDPELVRPNDVPYLVGDAAKLRAATGWTPRVSLEDTLREVLDAQAD